MRSLMKKNSLFSHEEKIDLVLDQIKQKVDENTLHPRSMQKLKAIISRLMEDKGDEEKEFATEMKLRKRLLHELEEESLEKKLGDWKSRREKVPPRRPGTNITIHVMAHSHWDREWYLGFERFRYGWVKTFDQLIINMRKDKRVKFFHLDGQFVLIDDYLKLRPEMRSVVYEMAARGKISLGPFYTQSDTILVSGEALIRNTLYGIEKAEKIGKSMGGGYLPDTFGHHGQTPQIFLGLGLPYVVVGRGTAGRFGQRSMIGRWLSPEGSEVLVFDLTHWYCHEGEFTPDARNTPLDKMATEFDKVVAELKGDMPGFKDLFLPYGCDHTPLDPAMGAFIEKANRYYNPMGVEFVSSNWDDYASRIFQAIKEDPNVMRMAPVYDSELKSGDDVNHNLVSVISIRQRQKIDNFQSSLILEKYAEPFSSLASILDPLFVYDDVTFDYAWELMFENHAHDSIYGCSVDEVAYEVDTRFMKLKSVAEMLLTDSIRVLMENINFSPYGGKDSHGSVSFVVFNPLPIPRRDELVVGIVDVFHGSIFGTPHKLTDSHGNDVPFRIIFTKAGASDYVIPDRLFRLKFAVTARMVLAILAPIVPAMGYEVFTLEAKQQSNVDAPGGGWMENWMHGDARERARENSMVDDLQKHSQGNQRRRVEEKMDVAGQEEDEEEEEEEEVDGMESSSQQKKKLQQCQLSNEIYDITINRYGRVKIVNKEDNVVFEELNIFQSCLEDGHLYRSQPFSCKDTSNMTLSTGSNALFSHCTMEGYVREVLYPDLMLEVSFLLVKKSRRLDVRVKMTGLSDQVDSLLFSAVFRVHDRISKYFVDKQFDTTSNFIANGVAHYQNRFSGFIDKRGQMLMVAGRGVTEVHDGDRGIKITLLRLTDNLADWFQWKSPNALEHGNFTIEYSLLACRNGSEDKYLKEIETYISPMTTLMPYRIARSAIIPKPAFSSNFSPLDLIFDDLNFNLLVESGGNSEADRESIRMCCMISNSTERVLPPSFSFMEIQPENLVVFSAFKKTRGRNSYILRFYAPGDSPVDSNVTLHFKIRSAFFVNLREKRIGVVKPNVVNLVPNFTEPSNPSPVVASSKKKREAENVGNAKEEDVALNLEGSEGDLSLDLEPQQDDTKKSSPQRKKKLRKSKKSDPLEEEEADKAMSLISQSFISSASLQSSSFLFHLPAKRVVSLELVV